MLKKEEERRGKTQAEELRSGRVIPQSHLRPGVFSRMSRQCVAGKLEGGARTTLIQSVQRQVQEATIGAIRPLLTEFCEAEVSAKLGREKRTLRRVSPEVREIDWCCGHCGCRDANQFTRDGHDRRA